MNWVNLTDRCIEALLLAQREATFLGDPQVGTEHILIGLLVGGKTVGAQILAAEGVDHAAVRALVDATRASRPATARSRFTERAQKTVQLSLECARAQGAPLVTTDHLFIGLLKQPDCTACQILEALSVGCEAFLEKLQQEGAPRISATLGEAAETEAMLDADLVMSSLDLVQQALERIFVALTKRFADVAEVSKPWPLPALEEELPLSINEETYPIGSLVQRILSRAIVTEAQEILMEPRDSYLAILYKFSGGTSQCVEVPMIFKDVVPFSVMRQARLNPMEKGRELQGELMFPHHGHSHRLEVHSEPIHKGFKLRIHLSRTAA